MFYIFFYYFLYHSKAYQLEQISFHMLFIPDYLAWKSFKNNESFSLKTSIYDKYHTDVLYHYQKSMN